MVAIGGVSVFVTLGWETLGGTGLFLVALAVMAVAAWLTHHFLVELKLPIPAGLMAALVVAAAPLAVYGIQRSLGYWPAGGDLSQLSHHRRLAMDRHGAWHARRRRRRARRWRLPFSVMPIAVTLWYMSMELAPLLQAYLTGNLDPNDPKLSYEQKQNFWKSYWVLRQWVSVVVGLVIMSGAIALDFVARSRRDYAFWLHLAGVAAFWGGLSSMSSDSEVGKFIYFLINVAISCSGPRSGDASTPCSARSASPALGSSLL